MSNDAISRQAAIDAIRASTQKYTGFMEMEMYTDDDAVEAIINLPSAQPEIVRCEECINHGKEICYFWSHFYGTINTPDDGFCHKAERKTDG